MTEAELEEKIKKTLHDSVVVLIVAGFIALVSLICDFSGSCGSNMYSFQRSGAVAVLLAAGVEYWLSQISAEINPPTSSYVAETKWKEKYGGKFSCLSVAAICFLVGGTFIWGYGDIPFKNS